MFPGARLGGSVIVQGVSQRAFHELAAMDLHRRQRAELAGEFLNGEVFRLLRRFSAQQFGGHRRHGDGRLAAERLERSAVDDALAVLFGEFQPHPQHVAALGRADRAHGVGILDFPLVLGIGEGFLDFGFERTHGGEDA